MTMSYASSGSSNVNPQEEIDRESANPIEEPLLSIEWVKSTLETQRKVFEGFYQNCEEAEEFYLSNFA